VEELLGVLPSQLDQVRDLRVSFGQPDQQPAQGVTEVADGVGAVDGSVQPQPQVSVDDGGDGRRQDHADATPLHCAGRDTDTNSERTWAGCPPG